jgi:hypothetical protein
MAFRDPRRNFKHSSSMESDMTRSNLEHEKQQFGSALSKTYGRLQSAWAHGAVCADVGETHFDVFDEDDGGHRQASPFKSEARRCAGRQKPRAGRSVSRLENPRDRPPKAEAPSHALTELARHNVGPIEGRRLARDAPQGALRQRSLNCRPPRIGGDPNNSMMRRRLALAKSAVKVTALGH